MPEKPSPTAIERIMWEEISKCKFGNEAGWDICRRFLTLAYWKGIHDANNLYARDHNFVDGRAVTFEGIV